jgi:hypothetical protein
MKRCPKCNRTFPDENQKFCTVDGGLLIAAAPAFDPNATMRATSADLSVHSPEVPRDRAATSRELIDPNATIASSSVAPTVVFPRNTAPTGPAPTSGTLPSSPQPQAAPPVSAAIAPPKQKSKLPWILGGLLLLLLLGAGGAVGLFFFVIKPRLDQLSERTVELRKSPSPEQTNQNSNSGVSNSATPQSETKPETDTFVPPADAIKFTSSKANLDGKLAEHFLYFSFYYPKSWQTDPKAGVPGATSFVKVERMLPPDFTQENLAVGWYTSKGTFEADRPSFPDLVKIISGNLAKNFPEYRKVSEGPVKVNSLDGYEFRFVSLSKGTEKGDLQLWGRVIFLPSGVAGETSGVTLSMLATSLAPELSGVEDVGEKGEMPVILESFRFGRSQ